MVPGRIVAREARRRRLSNMEPSVVEEALRFLGLTVDKGVPLCRGSRRLTVYSAPVAQSWLDKNALPLVGTVINAPAIAVPRPTTSPPLSPGVPLESDYPLVLIRAATEQAYQDTTDVLVVTGRGWELLLGAVWYGVGGFDFSLADPSRQAEIISDAMIWRTRYWDMFPRPKGKREVLSRTQAVNDWAAFLGVSVRYIEYLLDVVDFPTALKELLQEGRISQHLARTLWRELPLRYLSKVINRATTQTRGMIREKHVEAALAQLGLRGLGGNA